MLDHRTQITTFQLKGARNALDITTKHLGEYIQFSSTTISTLEKKGFQASSPAKNDN